MSAKRIYVVEDSPVCPPRAAFGCDPKFATVPISNLPVGAVKVRRRIRAHEMAQVFVKTEDGAVTRYFAGPDGPEALMLLWPMGVNAGGTR